MLRLATSTTTLDEIAEIVDTARKGTSQVKVDRAALFRLVADHRDMVAALERAGVHFAEQE